MRKILFCIFISLTQLSYGQVTNCNNWLSTPSYISAVNIGKLNVTGNQITVEATIYQTAINKALGTGDIVSKHTDPSDDNYLLRPDYCSITTTNGFYQTGDICKIENNKTYHVAMVYDGAKLKFYRNGFLMSELAATGNLFQNNQDTRIGYYAYQFWNTQFFGYINEVRIWNVARTQAQIKAYTNTSLPAPTTQAGLLAYYTFDDLINKQGNPSWNGTLVGSATINQKNPSCNFIADSCIVPASISNIINDYIEVTGYQPCYNELIVKDATKYNPGDTVLIIQMKGADIDLSNSANFGNISDYKTAGNYEMNIIKKKNGNALSLLNNLEKQYDIPNGKVQLIRVPYYATANITSTLTCLPWDGSKGGVLVLNAKEAINLSADIDVSGKGFSGGKSPNPNTTTLYCNFNDFYYPANTKGAADKGESISDISSGFAWGKGSPANGGGGGSGHNSGGGGGSNGGAGGFGGYQLDACGGSATDNRGIGGKNLLYTNASNKIFLGGGGGSGHTDNAGGSNMNGGNGGGIVIIKSPIINNAGFKINAKGADVINCSLSPVNLCHDGNGGGGGGGTVLIESANFTSSTSVDISGGKGGDLIVYYLPNASHIGPGGGGGAGTLWVNSPALPSNVTVSKAGGKNGVIIQDGNNPYGTTPGQDGINLFNLKIPVTNTLFKPNIDSVRINTFNHNCNNVDFQGLGYTQTTPINTWSWNFGDGKTNNFQNVTYAYPLTGTYNVKLIATDVNGCKDSFAVPVTIKDIKVTKSTDTSLCGSSPVKIFAAGGSAYSWSPTIGLDNPNISNPVVTPLVSTKYYITVTNTEGCSKKDSVNILVNSIPAISKSNDTSICKNVQILLLAGGGSSYNWSPASELNNPNIANPVANPVANTTYIVKVTNTDGCSKIDSIKVVIKPVPIITKSNDTTICRNTPIKIFAAGGSSYLWSPASTLDNSSSATPVASPLLTTTYTVAITDAQSCTYHDSIKISVRDTAVFSVSPDNSVCYKTPQHLAAAGGSSYLWSPASFLDDPNVSNPVATPDATITYSVRIKENICNESATLFTKITVLPLPNVQAKKSNDITCAFPSSHLTASGAQNYIWTPVANLSNPGISNPIATPAATTLYTVTAKDFNGCSNSDTISVNVGFNINVFYGLPNSFTPNGDGINDCFGVKYWGHIDELDFSIYNRFGERVFHTNNSANCWDGFYKGQPQDSNAFVYIIKAKTACGNIDKKGTVMLLR